ncbi:S41 family peptidase [Ammoniphilus sp. 3BR4]|uniref:S41 family peptidase n=1 Tax=Ammoniphilus sp. 3BR4 TaxID=3158265 RepID=UPI003465F3FE
MYKSFIYVTTLFFLFSSNNIVVADQKKDPNRERILEVYDLIQSRYLNTPDQQKLSDAAIKGMVQALQDPHTTFFHDQEFSDFLGYVEGVYSGIGVELNLQEGKMVVQEVYPGSPAAKANIQLGDTILSVNGVEAVNEGVIVAVAYLQGPEGSTVSVEFKRDDEIQTVELTRQKVHIPLVKSRLRGSYGYLSLSTFNEESVGLFKQELAKLQRNNMKGLVLDLRNNLGGTLESALQFSGFFIEDGTIVIMKEKDGNEKELKIKNGSDWQLPLVILVNENTASAAELIASALRDNGKAKVIGALTYGKGTVQEAIPLGTGGVLKLTVEEYFSPNHTVIHNVGLYPDIFVDDPIEQLQAAFYVLKNNSRIILRSAGDVLINGERDESPIELAFQKKGTWYLSMRKMAYLWNGKVSYDIERHEVSLQLGTKNRTYKIGNTPSLTIKDGVAYLALDEVLRRYDGIQMKNAQGALVLYKSSLEEY